MMKLIHTSDWHLGQNFYGYDRNGDHFAMTEALAKFVAGEKPDLLLVSGDIYDTATPSLTVQKQLSEYLLKIRKACEGMKIICISGNHDSASRHEIFQMPWEELGVYMLGRYDRLGANSSVYTIPGKCIVAAVPYMNARFTEDDAIYKTLQEQVKILNKDGLPVIFMGHLAVSNCNVEGHETIDDKYVGGIEFTDISRLGGDYDYYALGHIHKAQTFYGGRARYCGSPCPVSFDEVRPGYEHGFTIVEMERHGEQPRIRTVNFEGGVPLVNIPSEDYAPWNEVIKELKEFPSDLEAYIRLNVLLENNASLPIDRERQVASALSGKKGRYCLINPMRRLNRPGNDGGESRSLAMEELRQANPMELIKMYYSQTGRSFDDHTEKMFKMIISNLEESSQDED